MKLKWSLVLFSRYRKNKNKLINNPNLNNVLQFLGLNKDQFIQLFRFLLTIVPPIYFICNYIFYRNDAWDIYNKYNENDLLYTIQKIFEFETTWKDFPEKSEYRKYFSRNINIIKSFKSSDHVLKDIVLNAHEYGFNCNSNIAHSISDICGDILMRTGNNNIYQCNKDFSGFYDEPNNTINFLRHPSDLQNLVDYYKNGISTIYTTLYKNSPDLSIIKQSMADTWSHPL